MDFLNEAGKAGAALFVGSLSTYLLQRRKEKANRLAEIVAQSDYWKKEVKELKEYTDEKIKDLQTQLDECNERNK